MKNVAWVSAVSVALVLGVVVSSQLSDRRTRLAGLAKRVERLENRLERPVDSTAREDRSGAGDQTAYLGLRQRLEAMESSLERLLDRPSVENRESSASEAEAAQGADGRLDELGRRIESLEKAIESLSPVAPLESYQAEITRAGHYVETNSPGTAAHAYSSILSRYELPSNEREGLLGEAVDSFDLASQRNEGFVTANPSLLAELEAQIPECSPEKQGTFLHRLANGCMHSKAYSDALRLFEQAVDTSSPPKIRLNCYWSMAFAARYAKGEEAFFDVLGKGLRFGLEHGLDVSSFEKEIESPRKRED